MPTPRKNPATKVSAPKAAPVPAPKPIGLDANTILLAALAIHADGELVVPFAAYGEVLARQADIKGVTVRTGATGVEVEVDWDFPELEDDDTEKAVNEVMKSAYTPAGPTSDAGLLTTAPARPSVEAPKVGPAADRPSFTRPAHDHLANTGA